MGVGRSAVVLGREVRRRRGSVNTCTTGRKWGRGGYGGAERDGGGERTEEIERRKEESGKSQGEGDGWRLTTTRV